ncbi:MAG TPA: hypothetical protein DHD79_01195 [Firmicutes bacterium]|jgi:ABC-2 type transport system ATP-binding protein|nr:hypothetical protein [Bacillota bacterium]HAW72027.1 hypothetical protein [Bacillota bacterium]HBE06736.1 hypothetical protein [Bacillota bacterium]HBR25351.1 hypothetical protein [Bacillota bacterium]HCF90748.1 hypothetical protein [Bacillota bacterium]
MTIALQCDRISKVFYEKDETKATGTPLSYRRLFRRERVPVYAVRETSFTVEKGEIFGILGPNGSGKSTLIRIIATLLYPDEGTVTVFGNDVVKQQLEVRRMINRVSVEAAFFKKLSAIENLNYAARLYGVNTKIARQRSLEILQRLGFKEQKAFVSLENLSRGMQQKVAIARALFTAPVLLLLDEPTTGLDPKSKRDVQDFVKEVQEKHDATIILTTHDMAEAERLCDRVAIIDDGRFVALDTPAGLKRKLQSPQNPAPTMDDVFFALTGKDLADELPDLED